MLTNNERELRQEIAYAGDRINLMDGVERILRRYGGDPITRAYECARRGSIQTTLGFLWKTGEQFSLSQRALVLAAAYRNYIPLQEEERHLNPDGRITFWRREDYQKKAAELQDIAGDVLPIQPLK